MDVKEIPIKTQLTRNSTVSVTDLQNIATERLRTDTNGGDDKSNLSIFHKDSVSVKSKKSYRRNFTSMINMDHNNGFTTSRELEIP